MDDGAYLEIDGKIYRPRAHEEFMLEPGMKHRFWAEETDFRMVVVCFGEWTAEDQVRHADDYGREGTALKL
jgi:D-lyxose ketol-isomerase